jgi:trehalose 6-phosphate synthase/phosphatase
MDIDMVCKKFREASKRIVFLDYDGTLTTTHKIPEFAAPSSRITQMVKTLQCKENTYVYVLSGRSRCHLDNWFRGTGIGLSAEHGCFYRHTGESQILDNWIRLANNFDSSWRDIIRPLFQHYTERTPGSFIEEKEINLTWHYRHSDPEFGSWQAQELQVNLEKILSHMAVSIILGNKTLELRPSSVDKATAACSILRDLGIKEDKIDFVLCVGDGKTDEVVFSALKEHHFALTATVGKKRTDAKYYLDTVQDVETLLNKLNET